MVLRRVYKAGNALVFAIPAKYAAALSLTAGSQVAVRVQDRGLRVCNAIILPADAIHAPAPAKDGAHE